MIYDSSQPPPRSRQEARERFAAAWRRAETLIFGRKEAAGFLARWEALSPEAKETVNIGARYEWGDDLEVGEVLSRATYGWDGRDNGEIRAEALRPLLQWCEAEGWTTKWFGDAGNSPMVEFILEEMRELDEARPRATPSGVRTLLGHLGR